MSPSRTKLATGGRAVLEAASLVSVATLAFAAGLLLWTLVPMLFGWSPTVVVSGSMAPGIRTGDVIVCAPVKKGDLRAGYVIRFQMPGEPDRYFLHRIVEINKDGTLKTQGDANRDADSTPVPPANVTGMGRLRILWAGLPAIWWRNHDYVKIGLLAATIVGLCVLSSYAWAPLGGEPDDPGDPFLDEGSGFDGWDGQSESSDPAFADA